MDVMMDGRGRVGPKSAAVGETRHNLPAQLTSFIGREQEIADIRQLLSTTRLVTLSGAGGVGKTRLAAQIAADGVETYPDGVWLVELAALADPSLVSHTVASTLGLRDVRGRDLTEALVDYLKPRTLLLVLDNCEHLVGACAQLTEVLLRACRDLRILATSRESLGIAGETAWRVPSLPIPDRPSVSGEPVRGTGVQNLEKYEAVRLFVERALAALPTFRVTDQSLVAVAQICRRLDGIPLAIELAAARVKVLSVEQIAARLDDRFRLLTGGSRTAQPRQQTLRATIGWSFDLLSQAEQAMARRLSVFAAGWTLGAVETVCAGGGIAADEVLDLLSHLVDKSLVLVGEGVGGEARYRLLETVRQYGQERLLEAGEAAELQHRHAGYYLSFAEAAWPRLVGPEMVEWLSRLEAEHDNFRAALAWSQTGAGGPEVGLRLVGALAWFWLVRGYFSEGRRWTEQALATSEGVSASARARALFGVGLLARSPGDYERAAAALEESVALYRTLGDELGRALSLSFLGIILRDRGDFERAVALFEESLRLSRDRGDRWRIAIAIQWLGVLALDLGDGSRATALIEESVALYRELGEVRGVAFGLRHLGRLAAARGEHERAGMILKESLALSRDLGDRRGTAWSLHCLGLVAHAQGDDPRATALHEASLSRRREIGDRTGIAECLAGLAAVACSRKHVERAARLFGAAEALREAIGAPLSPGDRADYEPDLTAVQRRLDHDAVAAAWADGRIMPIEQAMDYARASVESPAATAPGQPSADDRPSPLTRREREVAALVGRGLTNRQIAEALVIAERTADAHVGNILGKLGFGSRAQVAAWVVEQGLLTSGRD